MKFLHTRSDDGTKLRLARWNEEGERDILLIHGLAEHLGRYEHIGAFFAEKGWRVTALELRGHGESEGKRGHTESWDRYVEDVQAAMGTIGKEMTIVAHSMGGLVTLAAMMHPMAPKVHSVVLSNPLIGLFGSEAKIKLLIGRALSRLMPRLSLPTDLDPNNICRDPEVVQKYIADPLIFSGVTARWATEMIKMQAKVMDYAGTYKLPMNLLIGDEDKICDPDVAKEFAGKYGGEIQTDVYPPCFHELFNEPEKLEILAKAETWIQGTWAE